MSAPRITFRSGQTCVEARCTARDVIVTAISKLFVETDYDDGGTNDIDSGSLEEALVGDPLKRGLLGWADPALPELIRRIATRRILPSTAGCA